MHSQIHEEAEVPNDGLKEVRRFSSAWICFSHCCECFIAQIFTNIRVNLEHSVLVLFVVMHWALSGFRDRFLIRWCRKCWLSHRSKELWSSFGVGLFDYWDLWLKNCLIADSKQVFSLLLQGKAECWLSRSSFWIGGELGWSLIIDQNEVSIPGGRKKGPCQITWSVTSHNDILMNEDVSLLTPSTSISLNNNNDDDSIVDSWSVLPKWYFPKS